MIIDALKYFYRDEGGVQFTAYSMSHLFATLVYLVLPISLLFIFKKQLRAMKHRRFFEVAIGVIGLAIEFIQYYWHYYNGDTAIRDIYPTSLCGLTIYLTCLALITNSKRLMQLGYFFSFGAVLTYAVPDGLFLGADSFRYFAFFFIHTIILFNAFYFVIIRDIKADWNAFWYSSAVMAGVLVISFILNNTVSETPMYLNNIMNSREGFYRANYFYIDWPLLEGFPVFQQAYDFSRYLYSLLVVISYYLLMLIMVLIGKIFAFHSTAVTAKNA